MTDDTGTPITVSVATLPGYDLVTVTGELDASTRHRMDEGISSLREDGPGRLVLDLRDVTFLDSSGIGSLVAARRRATSRGVAVSIVCADNHIRRVLHIACLDQVMDIASDLPRD